MLTRIVKGEDLIPKKISPLSKKKSYVARKRIWVDNEDRWRTYYFQNTLKNKDDLRNPLAAVKAYGGSSDKGKNIPQEKMLRDERNTSEPTETSIFFWGTSKQCARVEQGYIMGHDWPEGGIEEWTPRHQRDDDCYNLNASGKGCWPTKDMKNHIAYTKLQKKIENHILWLENPTRKDSEGNPHSPQFDAEFDISNDKLQELLDAESFIQSRVGRYGNRHSIKRYKRNFNRDIDHTKWPAIWLLLPKPDTKDLEIILDGNQRSGGVNQVKKVENLKAIGIPYSDWNGIQNSSLESIGNYLNSPAEDIPDFRGDEDTFRTLRNIINENNIDTDEIYDDPRVNDHLSTYRYLENEEETILNKLVKEFHDKAMADRKEQEGSLDFSDDGLKPDENDDGTVTPSKNLYWYIVAKKCIQKKYGNKFNDENTTKISNGQFRETRNKKHLGGNPLPRKISNYEVKHSSFPVNFLGLIQFNFEQEYEEYCEDLESTSHPLKDQLQKLNKLVSGVTNLVVEPLPLTKGAIQALEYYDEVVQEIKDENEKIKFVPDKIDEDFLTFDDKNDTIKELKFDIKKHNYRKKLAA